MTPEAPTALHADACPDAEQLAAYIDGALSPSERTTIEMHLLQCADCRDVVGGAVALAGTAAPAARTRPRRTVLAIGGGILAVAAAVLLVVRLQDRSPYYVLVAAVGTSRPVTPRLTGGFQYGVPPSPTRGGPEAPSLIVAGAAERTRAAATRATGPMADAAIGVTDLLLGDTGHALESLRRAATASDDPRIHSDLAAALIVDAERSGNVAAYRQAAEAADEALKREPTSPEARFNRALALEALGSPEAAAAWRRYLEGDPDSAWAGEARRHLERLSPGTGKQ